MSPNETEDCGLRYACACAWRSWGIRSFETGLFGPTVRQPLKSVSDAISEMLERVAMRGSSCEPLRSSLVACHHDLA
jgi:hypothetical protein